MGKIFDRLQYQLKIEEYAKDAHECLSVYYKLKEISDGHIWSEQWNPLVSVKHIGEYPNSHTVYSLNDFGKIFLNGILNG